jgi:uncharacterized membrane protein
VKVLFLKGLPKSVFLTIIVIVMAFSTAVLGVLTASQTLSSSGTVTVISTPNLAVYSDSACTQTLTSINWGSLAPGQTASKTIYIKNTGNVPLTLSMDANGWNPSTASNYMTLTWNRQSSSLAVNQVVSADLTLVISPSINGLVTSFSVNIVITGTS